MSCKKEITELPVAELDAWGDESTTANATSASTKAKGMALVIFLTA